MAGLVVVLIILGCVAYQYLKGTFLKAFAAIIIAICASVVAFGYFEILANVFVSRSDNSRYLSLAPWAQSLSFVLLLVLAFGILQTIVNKLTREPIDLGLLAERIGRVVCGIFLGLILSGLLLTALAMAPLSNKYPYQRFYPTNPNAEKPKKVLLNADGFVTGWFSMMSRGAFSGKRSFAALHPNFLDQVFLNRHSIAEKECHTGRPGDEGDATGPVYSASENPLRTGTTEGTPTASSGTRNRTRSSPSHRPPPPQPRSY